MRTQIWSISLALAAAAPYSAWAAPIADSTLMPLDTLREALYKKNRSVPAKKLGGVTQALAKRKWAEARRLAAPLTRDELFGDLAVLLTALSYREEGAQALDSKKPNAATARDLAHRSITLFAQVELMQPYSPWVKRVPQEIGVAELVIADSMALSLGKAKAAKGSGAAEAQYEKAFQRLAANNAIGLVRPVSLENYGKLCRKATQASLCSSWIQKLSGSFSKNSAETAGLLRGFPAAADRPKANPGYSRATQTYKSPDPDGVGFDEAITSYLAGNYKDARKEFEAFVDEFPRSGFRFRARYWLGQVYSRLGDTEKSRKVLEDVVKESPLSYYGILAGLALGKPVQSYMGTAMPMARAGDGFLQPAELMRLKRAQKLIAEGVKDLAAEELRDLKPRGPLSSAFLMYLAMLDDEAGYHSGSFVVLTELIQRGFDGVFTQVGAKLVFPVAYYPLIEKNAVANKIDPVLLLSLIKQESAFESRAASGPGAQGLMQLMPATAIDTEAGVLRVELGEAEHNIRIGTKYLKQLITRFDGNLVFALAAYNAGPGAVNRWIRENRAKKGMLEFIEQIPFKETREYVSSIVRNHFWYSSKLRPNEPVKGLEYFWPSAPAAPASPAPNDSEETPAKPATPDAAGSEDE